MPATNRTPIQLYYSTTAAAVPAVANLVNGELAINITDGKLYYKDNTGAVKLLASSAAASSTGNVVGPASATDRGIALFDGTTGKLIKDSASTDALIRGLTVGLGGGSVTSNIAFGQLALVNNSSGNGNTAIGNSTLTSNTSGSGNIAIGYGAEQATTTGGANVAIGTNALTLNTTGSNNVAIGYQTLNRSVSAVNNVALGSEALFNNVGSYSVAVGYRALYTYTDSSGANTAVGNLALTHATTAAANVAVGDSVLSSNTIGDNNTGVGAGVLASNVDGSNNVAMGYQSLYSNNNGSGSVAIGFKALYSNVSVGGNVAIGNQAMTTSTTGGYNVAVGNTALSSNISGGDNTAVGSGALASNTIGSDNTAIGQLAMQLNTTGIWNVAIGSACFSNNTTGSSNTVAGLQAGYKNTVGSNNTFFGWQAGFTNTVSSSNTFIGSQAGYSFDYTAGVGATLNTFIGANAGAFVSTGVRNVIIGGFTGNTGELDIRTSNNNIVLSDGDGTIRIRLDGSGIFFCSGLYNNTTSTGTNVAVDSNGAVRRVSSALKYKHAINAIENVDISGLRPVRFKSKCPGDDPTMVHFGLIAEEVAKAGFEELITRSKTGEIEGLQYDRLTVVLLKKIQTMDSEAKQRQVDWKAYQEYASAEIKRCQDELKELQIKSAEGIRMTKGSPNIDALNDEFQEYIRFNEERARKLEYLVEELQHRK